VRSGNEQQGSPVRKTCVLQEHLLIPELDLKTLTIKVQE
jgi:hypothetical protein